MLRWLLATVAGWLCYGAPVPALAAIDPPAAGRGLHTYQVPLVSSHRPLIFEAGPPNTASTTTRFSTGIPSLLRLSQPTLPAHSTVTSSGTSTGHGRRWAALGASLVPGILVHGAGSWVIGERDTARRLLYIELAGIGLAAGSLAGLAYTGAARAFVAPLAALGMFGVGAFGVSFLADVYNVAAPPEGWGRSPNRVSLVEASVGYTYLHQQQFRFSHLLRYSLQARGGRVLVGAAGSLAPRDAHDHTLLEAGYRFWGATPSHEQHDGSFLEARAGLYRTRYAEEDFTTRGHQLLLTARLDSERWAPEIHGAFAEASLGYARRVSEFDMLSAKQVDALLLGGFAFGVYHGEPERLGGWSKLYYDHRHDGYAAGLLTPGLGSGVIGHFGLEVHHYLSSRFGLSVVTELGSAWLLTTLLRVREWGGH